MEIRLTRHGRHIAIVTHALLKNDAYSKLIIAAVNGDCVGGSLELMLSTDIRAAVPTARFGLTEVSATIADHALTREAIEQQLGDAVRASSDFAEGIAAFRRSARRAMSEPTGDAMVSTHPASRTLGDLVDLLYFARLYQKRLSD
jgi:hypothetical protein